MDYFTITGLFGYALEGFNSRWINPLILFQSSVCVWVCWDSNPSHGQKKNIYIHTHIHLHIHTYMCDDMYMSVVSFYGQNLGPRTHDSRQDPRGAGLETRYFYY